MNIFQQSRSLKETVDTYNNDIYIVLRRNGGKLIFLKYKCIYLSIMY